MEIDKINIAITTLDWLTNTLNLELLLLLDKTGF